MDHLVPLVDRNVVEGTARDGGKDGGVVDQHVDPPIGLECPCDHGLDRGQVADIGLDRQALTARSLDLRSNKREVLTVQFGENRDSPGCGEGECVFPAQPLARAGDDGHAPADIETIVGHGVPSQVLRLMLSVPQGVRSRFATSIKLPSGSRK